MKILFFLFVAILFSACNKTENGWSKLTVSEKEHLQRQAAIKCTADSERNFLTFQDSSGDQFNSSSSRYFRRKKTWNWSKAKGSDVRETKKFTVWKVTTTAVYFVVTSIKDSLTTYQFLKIEDSQNDEMIQDLKKKKCSTLVDFMSVTNGSSSATLTYEPAETNSGSNQRTKVTGTYTFPFSQLAFFGVLNEKQVIQTINNSDNQIVTTDSYTGTVTEVADEEPPYATLGGFSNTPSFCYLKKNGDGSYTFPYNYLSNCSSNASTGPDGWTNPGSEL